MLKDKINSQVESKNSIVVMLVVLISSVIVVRQLIPQDILAYWSDAFTVVTMFVVLFCIIYYGFLSK